MFSFEINFKKLFITLGVYLIIKKKKRRIIQRKMMENQVVKEFEILMGQK